MYTLRRPRTSPKFELNKYDPLGTIKSFDSVFWLNKLIAMCCSQRWNRRKNKSKEHKSIYKINSLFRVFYKKRDMKLIWRRMASTMNRLANETSPYLLQHKNNPVDWYPWGEEALNVATSLNRPILLSIGYSTCHWCHVMERESFEKWLFKYICTILMFYLVKRLQRRWMNISWTSRWIGRKDPMWTDNICPLSKHWLAVVDGL